MYTTNKNIKLTIKRMGLNQALVAQEIGISYSYFTKLLQAPLSPQWEHRTRMAIQNLLKKQKQQQQKVLEWFDNPESGLLGDDYYKKEGRNIE